MYAVLAINTEMSRGQSALFEDSLELHTTYWLYEPGASERDLVVPHARLGPLVPPPT